MLKHLKRKFHKAGKPANGRDYKEGIIECAASEPTVTLLYVQFRNNIWQEYQPAILWKTKLSSTHAPPNKST